ncbi:BT_3987 domain-containing protein [Ornithobacterium rhinotracheale]|uniref:BT_3987 domain-containing protein n=1 Tax=Ornithobacterium rhinotracheale TaxID=28251 RepID=UPI001FF458B4|nr:DUF1735 domain-containing protein [Ornithobacterium rhinotracheale]MCK0204751.1 DUF1735 and LamG domain-containing protein [Ornithobacterium rhinotracheale]
MRNLKNILLAAGTSLALFGCSYEDSVPEPQNPNVAVGYIEQILNNNTLKFTVNDEGGSTFITPRISNISNGDASFDFEIAPELLDKFNRENNSNYQLLPANVYNLVNKSSKKDTAGKSLHIALAKGEYGANIEVKVGAMQDEAGNKLPVSTSYAIPVRMKNIKGTNIVDTGKNTETIIFLNRSFKTNVLYMKGRINIASKGTEAKLYKEWTAQYSFMPKKLLTNFGLLYPDNDGNKKRGHATYYATLYGAQVTQFTPSGSKFKFNQAGYENFTFEENKWYNISLVYQAGSLSFYVNGNLAYKSPWDPVDNWTGIKLGNETFNGYAREIRFWNRPLSASEVNSTMYFADPSAEGLEVYLPLNRENQTENIATKTKGQYEVSFDSGAASNHNFDTEVTVP